MPDVLVRLADGTATWLLTYLMHSTALILGTWALTRFAPLQAVTKDFLWKLALLAGVATASMASLRSTPSLTVDYASLSERFHNAEAGQLAWVGEASPPPIQIRARLIDPSPECRGLLRSEVRRGVPLMNSLEDVCGADGAFAWWHGALILWLLGGGIGCAVLLRRRGSLALLTRSLSEAAPRSRRILRELQEGERRCRTAGVKSSQVLNTACVLPDGTIAISPRCESELTDDELRAVLAHEMGHVIRRDPLWSTALRTLATIFWLQPLNRLGLAKVDEISEHLCDDWAVSRTGAAVGLATSICRVAEWALPGPSQPVLMSVVGRDGRGLSERVHRILFQRVPRREPRWVRHIAAVALLAPLYWLPVVRTPTSLHASIVVEEGGALLSDGESSWVSGPAGADIERIEIRRAPAGPDGEAISGTTVERRVVISRVLSD
jgi:Zn-dependent protease with chaperone function